MGMHSAGILLYRRLLEGELEVLLAHMGGPFWSRRNEGAWTVPKGEVEPGEQALDAARREFEEELGVAVPGGDARHLGEVRQSGGKRVEAWAIEADLDPADIVPGTFELEWPKGSGQRQAFPEVDRVAWFPLDEARGHIVAGQRPLLDALAETLQS